MSNLRSGGPARGDSNATAPTARPLPPRPSVARSVFDGGVVQPANPPVRAAAERKPRPDPGPLRIAIGLTGMATASALMTAFLGSAAGANAGTGAVAQTTVGTTDTTAVAAPSVRHIIRYVQLAPGQTAPPKAVVKQAPVPKPRVVVVTTKQSGKR